MLEKVRQMVDQPSFKMIVDNCVKKLDCKKSRVVSEQTISIVESAKRRLGWNRN